ncbi:MAG: DUF3800 domain-containing protein [Phycisphaerae bacterium]|nr:DUF3800 domain-containing protein [Phycisphaerae bacterium]
MSQPAPDVRHYYVDEAGDLTLFNKRGRVIIGREGVSRVFMVGVAYLPSPPAVRRALGDLRTELLRDPYFNDVPSMRPGAGKTALCFHAKDDLPEVRREVFKLLPSFGAKVRVAIRRKADVAEHARFVHRTHGRKLSQNDIYDNLVKRLFKNLLHKAEENRIVFARRGKSERQEALESAIAKAKRNFEATWKIPSDRPAVVESAYPSERAGLQVIDYYLWALQRLYERAEVRFFNMLADDFRLIMDLDDMRHKPYGEWYSDHNRLEMQKIKPVAG